MRPRMHEWPLVLFTALAIAGAGTLAAQPALLALGATEPAEVRLQAPWAIALVAVGLTVSLNHLGRRRRLLLASRRFGTSRLSTEAGLAVATVASGAALGWLPADSVFAVVLAWGVGVIAAFFLVALGLVYRLRGQVAWPDVAVIGPLLSGLAFGFIACASTTPEVLPATLGPTLILLGTDGLVFVARWIVIARAEPWLNPSHPGMYRHRRSLLLARLVLVTLAPASLLIAGVATLADLFIGIGLLVDRVAFHGLALQHTTEAEIAHVEQILEGG
jgi:DMSO reductase anchor subunit